MTKRMTEIEEGKKERGMGSTHVQANTHDLHKELKHSSAVMEVDRGSLNASVSLNLSACVSSVVISHSYYFRQIKFSTLSSRLWIKCILLAWRRIGIPMSGTVFLSRWCDRCCVPGGCKTDDGLSCSSSGWDQSITPCTAGARLTLKLSTLREFVYCLNDLHTPWRLLSACFGPNLSVGTKLFCLWPTHTHIHKYLSPLQVSFTFFFVFSSFQSQSLFTCMGAPNIP